MGKKAPYVPPKLSQYDGPEIPSELRDAAEALRKQDEPQFPLHVAPDYTTVVDTEHRYVQVSDSFCRLVGYRREELIGKKYDEISAPDTNDIPTIFNLFMREGYMHGLWMLVHRTGTRILVRYDAWIRSDAKIESNMELIAAGYGSGTSLA
jgi:PAS domain S-box-containing protein